MTFRGAGINEARSVALNRNRAIVGEVFGSGITGTDVVVRGYNASSGNIAWEDNFPNTSQVFVDAAGADAFAAIHLKSPGN